MTTILESIHPTSGFALLVEDEGDSIWAYLLDGQDRAIVADAWVRNKVEAPGSEELANYRGGPPPAVSGFDGGTPFRGRPVEDEFRVNWSGSGMAVHASLGSVGEVVLSSGARRGFSRLLVRSGPWGMQWDDAGVEAEMTR